MRGVEEGIETDWQDLVSKPGSQDNYYVGFEGGSEKIQYRYANFSLNAERKVTDKLFLTATVYSRVRTTNYTDLDARSFRGYRNQFASLGFSWKL